MGATKDLKAKLGISLWEVGRSSESQQVRRTQEPWNYFAACRHATGMFSSLLKIRVVPKSQIFGGWPGLPGFKPQLTVTVRAL